MVSDWWALRGWRQKISPVEIFSTTGESLLAHKLAAATQNERYKPSDHSDLVLPLRQHLRSQKNSRGSSNLSSYEKKPPFRMVSDWWALRGSNSRPSRCKRDALPAELSAHRVYGEFYTTLFLINQEKNYYFDDFFY